MPAEARRWEGRGMPTAAAQLTARRHLAWLALGAAVSFVVPLVLADLLEMRRDVYYGLYALAVGALFAGWARDTGSSLREMVMRQWRLALGLGLLFGAVSVGIVVG